MDPAHRQANIDRETPGDPVQPRWRALPCDAVPVPLVWVTGSSGVGKSTAFLCGCVENEVDVWDLFDLVVCVVVDNETLRERLMTRTTNAFGKNPEELAAALEHNDGIESTYRRFGATIIDGGRPPAEVADAILVAAAETPPTRRPD